MRFVCKHDLYTHQINPGTVSYAKGQGDAMIAIQTSPLLRADFERGIITGAEREACRQFFDGRQTGAYGGEQPGAQRHDGIFGSGIEGSLTGDMEGAFYSGSRWEFMYSMFDTADIGKCPPEYRAAYEAVLGGDADTCARESARLGFLGTNALTPSTDAIAGEIVCLDVLMRGKLAVDTPDGVVVTEQPAGPRWEPNFPWPAYDEIGGLPAVAAKAIVETCDLIGLDKERVAQYEVEHKARPAVVAKLYDTTQADAKERIATWEKIKDLEPTAQRAPAPPALLDPESDAPRQLDNVPREALTDGIDFSAFVQ